MTSPPLPVLLHVQGKLAVVVGGGSVGRRKARALRAAGAIVRLVCLEARPAAEEDPDLLWVTAPYSPAHLENAVLGFAAGPADLNARVVEDARARGLWVSSASDPEGGDFSFPASARRGNLLLAVGTGGASPTLAANLCEWLAGHIDDAFVDWGGLLGELRPLIQERIADPGRRARLLARLAEWAWLEEIRSVGKDGVRSRMQELVREAATLAEG